MQSARWTRFPTDPLNADSNDDSASQRNGARDSLLLTAQLRIEGEPEATVRGPQPVFGRPDGGICAACRGRARRSRSMCAAWAGFPAASPGPPKAGSASRSTGKSIRCQRASPLGLAPARRDRRGRCFDSGLSRRRHPGICQGDTANTPQMSVISSFTRKFLASSVRRGSPDQAMAAAILRADLAIKRRVLGLKCREMRVLHGSYPPVVVRGLGSKSRFAIACRPLRIAASMGQRRAAADRFRPTPGGNARGTRVVTDDSEILRRLELLRIEHRDLDAAIDALSRGERHRPASDRPAQEAQAAPARRDRDARGPADSRHHRLSAASLRDSGSRRLAFRSPDALLPALHVMTGRSRTHRRFTGG